MSTHSSLDPESFQKVLADAFVVQESEIENRSLCAVVELQALIATGELDIDRAMTLIADRARNVANATGIAIALLRGDQLTYRAGSGGSADRVGRHVTAILSVSRQAQSKDEILRVEDAHTERRIGAAICRQFAARSLLILPIFYHRSLIGVLEVIFTNAHQFHEREVRTYRLMASLVGDAMSHGAQLKPEKTAAEQPAIEQSVEQTAPQQQRPLNDAGLKSEPISNPGTRQTCRAHGASGQGPDPQTRGLSRSMMMRRAKRVPLYKRWVVATVLALVSWIAYRDRRPASTFEAPAPQRSNAIEQPSPSGPEKSSASSASKSQTSPVLSDKATTDRTAPRWFRVGKNELDYVAEDVTIRYFTATPARPLTQAPHSHVEHIGNDVTVRFFTPKHATAPPADR